MSIDLGRVAAIGREVAARVNQRLSVVSVTTTEGGSDRVELLVTVSGCHAEPCMHLINVSRAAPEMLEREVREKLEDALTSHSS